MRILLSILFIIATLYATEKPTPILNASKVLSNETSNDFALTPEELSWLRKNPTIILASADDYSHLAFRDKVGNIKGFDADLIAQINKNLNINITLKLFKGWGNTYTAAVEGKVDGILSLSHTPERESLFYFSPVYHQDLTYIITRKDTNTLKTLADLNGKNVGTERNSIMNGIVRKEAPDANIIDSETIEEVLNNLQTNRIDGALLEGINNYALDSLGLKISGSFFTKSGEYTIGTHKSKPLLATIIDKGIRSISKNSMQTLKNKWFNQPSFQSLFTPEELQYIQNTPQIKIGIEDWSPMISTKDGTVIEGIVGELLTRVIEISGLKTQLIPGQWSDLLRDFKNNKIDILPATYYTQERATYGLFGDAYTKIQNTIYVNKDNTSIHSFDDLKHKTLAIQKGFGTIDAIRKQYPNITIIETPTLEDAILKVSNKEADAFFEAQIVAQDIIKKLLLTNLKPIFQNNIEAGTLHLFSKKGDTTLQSILNKSLQSISPQEKNNIIDKWLHQDIKRNVNVAFTQNREPYSIDNSIIKGIEYDITKKALEKSNILINYEKSLSRTEMEHALMEDSKFNVAIGVKEKEDDLYYSDVLVNFENVAITRQDDAMHINNIQDLHNKKIIAFEGAHKYLGTKYYSLFNPQNKPSNYTETAHQDEQILALMEKKVDVIIMDKNIFHWFLNKLYGQTFIPYTFHFIFPQPNAYKVAFKDKNLRDMFDQNLQKMKQSGEYDTIIYNYLHTDIESKTKISSFISALVAKSIFTEDIKTINTIAKALFIMPYIEKIEIFNNENELLVSYGKNDIRTFTYYESFYHISQIPHKVGYIKVYFNDEKLSQYAQNNTIIPNITFFSSLDNYSEIKETYKKLDFLDKLSFTRAEEEFIQRHPVINFSAVTKYPFYMEENGKQLGLYVDFLKILEQKSGLIFHHVPFLSKNKLYENFNHEKIDLIADIDKILLEDRSAIISDDLIQFHLAIISSKEGTFIQGLQELKGRIIVAKDSFANKLLLKKYPNLQIIEAENIYEALQWVQKGKAEIFVGHEAESTHMLKTNYPDLKIIGISQESVSHTFATQVKNPELISIINKIIASMTYEQKQEIKDIWFKTKINTEVDYSLLYQIAGIAFFIILFGFIYSQHLKYLVKVKTLELNTLLSSFDKNVIAAKIDKDGKIIYASDALCLISEYSKEELLGNNPTILSNKTNKRTLNSFKKALMAKKQWSGKLINVSKSGKIYWTKTKLFPEYDDKGLFLNNTVISQDITAQKEVETLNQEIEDTQKEIIFKMGAIGEARSEETGMHVKRVAEYSRLFAIHYGLPHKVANNLKLASPMHDIGKVAIADSILNKPDKLTPEEFEIIKTHAELGYEMLKHSTRDILKTAAIIAHEHHEKYDGTGYPRGLAGDNIHIYGRITAIADVFDALGHKRVYKEAWENERIFEFFKKESGHHFDPKLVNIFFEHIDQFLTVQNSFKDA